MRMVSLERYYFVLYDGALNLKISKMALHSFCDKTLHILGTISRPFIKFTITKNKRNDQFTFYKIGHEQRISAPGNNNFHNCKLKIYPQLLILSINKELK